MRELHLHSPLFFFVHLFFPYKQKLFFDCKLQRFEVHSKISKALIVLTENVSLIESLYYPFFIMGTLYHEMLA